MRSTYVDIRCMPCRQVASSEFMRIQNENSVCLVQTKHFRRLYMLSSFTERNN